MMKQVTMKYLYRGKEREKTMSVGEWHQLLTGDKYATRVAAMRAIVTLGGGRNDAHLTETDALPEVCIGSTAAYRGLLVLTLPVDEGTSWARLRKTVSMLPQTLLAFRGSSGRTMKVVVQATLPDGRLPEGDRDMRLFQQHAAALAALFYEGQTGQRARLSGTDGSRRCRMSHDPEAFLNEHAVAFVLSQPTEPLPISVRRRTAAQPLVKADRLPGYDERKMQMTRFQFCYADVMAGNYQELDIMLEELARHTMKNGLEAEFCLQRLRHMHAYSGYEVLARRIFRNVYGMCYQRPQLLDAKENAVPYHTLNMEQLKQFMESRYLLRRNLITDGVEYVARGGCGADWQPLDRHMMNTMTMQALSEGIEAWDKDVQRYVDSTLVAEYDPVVDYLDSLPRWDGRDHVGALARCVRTHQESWEDDFRVWLRAMVGQWLHRQAEHGNALVPLLIGAQGDGKSTFCRRLLPEELHDYYTDRIDFSNRNVAERMLTRFCLINIDEYDSLSGRQNAFLKHVLQKADVKMRKLYDSQILNKQRYATFIGTTNDPTPLTDTTGSRRFMCIQLTGRIDNDTVIDHAQLYAQVLKELNDGLPSWFDQEREHRIQQQNSNFQLRDSIEEIFSELFRKPDAEGEELRLPASQILARMKRHYVSIKTDNSSVQRLSKLLVRRGFPRYRTNRQNLFGVMPVEG